MAENNSSSESMEIDSRLVRMCIEAATESRDAVEAWRRQRRTLERLPSQLADAFLHRLLRRRLLFPSLLEVFKNSVEEVNLKGENSVDAEWMAYIGGFQYLRVLNLSDCRRINSSSLWPISGMTTLKELDISRCSKVTDAGIRHVLSIPMLGKLWIAETGVTAEGVKLLCSLTNLSVLDLGGLPVTDDALSSLRVLNKLQHLVVWGSKLSDQGASVLKMFRGLRFLNLAWTSVTRLPALPSLEYLNMSNCNINSIFEGVGDKETLETLVLSGATISDVSEAFPCVQPSLSFLDLSYCSLNSFSFLTIMNAITKLDLSSCSVDDVSVEYIACIGASVRYLNLSKTKVSSAGVSTLAGHVPNLETLLLSYTVVDDIAISYISTMPLLKHISLCGTHVKGLLNHEESDEDWNLSLSSFQSLDRLETLDLEETRIKDAALCPLASVSKLSSLSLRSAPLTDACLYPLSQIRNLVNIAVRDAVLTNAWLESFNPQPCLEVLDLRGCWLLAQDDLMSFCQKHPSIEVRHELVIVSPSDKAGANHSSPPKYKLKQNKISKQPSPQLRFRNENFIDQRLKYGREELLAMRFVSATSSLSDAIPDNT